MRRVLPATIYIFSFFIFYGYGDLDSILLRLLWLLLVSLLLFLLLRNFSWSSKQAVLVTIWFTITPWVVQQSVVISGVHWFALLFLLSVYLFLVTRRKIVLLLSFVLTIFLGKFVYPQFWIYRSLSLPSWHRFLANFFHLFSFDQFFFENIFVGRRNSIGFFYPETIPIFLLGIYRLINTKKFGILLFTLVPWLAIILFTNEIIGGKEFFLLMPFFTVPFVLGWERLFGIAIKGDKGKIVKVTFIIYLILLFYGIVNFAHYFRAHYLPFEMG